MLGHIFRIAALAVVVFLLTLIYTAVFVIHPRRWWTHCTFDVEGYLQDELLPFVRSCGETLVEFKESNDEHVLASGLTVDRVTSVFKIRQYTHKARGVGAAVKSLLFSLVPSLKDLTIKDVTEASYKVEQLSKQLLDYDSPQSVLNARGSGTFNKVIASTGQLRGTAIGDAIFADNSGAAFCSSIDRESFEALKDGKPHPTLANRFLQITSLRNDDPFISLLGSCLAMPDPDEGWDTFSGAFTDAMKSCTALAELRRVYSVVGPQVRRMRMDRRPITNLMEIFKLFNFPYLVEFNSSASDAFDDFSTTKARVWKRSSSYLKTFKSMAHCNLTGEKCSATKRVRRVRREDYESPARQPYVRSTIFGVHVDENGREVVVEEMSVGKLIKSIGSVLDMLPKLITGAAELIKDVLTLVKQMVKSLAMLKRGPVAFITQVLKVLLFGALLLLLGIMTPVIHVAIFGAIGVTPLLIKLAFFTFIFGLASVCNLALAFGDMSTGGMLRFLARSEDHPEAHWKQAGAHSKNVSRRLFGTNIRCFEGFSPDISGFSCVKTSRCVPIYSPSSMLIRLNREGRFVSIVGGSTIYMHPALPDQSVKCSAAVRKYTAESNRPVKTNGFTVPVAVVRDLVLCICATRMHKPESQVREACKMCELALSNHPLKDVASEYGSPIRFTPEHGKKGTASWRPIKVVLASAVATAVVVSAVYLARELENSLPR